MYYLLIRGAFSKVTEKCSECGATQRIKTAGSWVCLILLLLLLGLIAAALFGPAEPSGY